MIKTFLLLAFLLVLSVQGNSPQRPGWNPLSPSYTIQSITPSVFSETSPGIVAFGLDHAFVNAIITTYPPQVVKFKQGINFVEVPVISSIPVGAFVGWDISTTVGFGSNFVQGPIEVQMYNFTTGVWSDSFPASIN